MNRRAFLSTGAAGLGLLAGCAGDGGSDRRTRSETATQTRTERPTATDTPTRTPRENPDTIFVDSEEGSTGAPGTADEPMGSIREALYAARPGETIQVRPGTYVERLETVRSGRPGKPITITGPPDAVLKSDPDQYNVVLIRHSHIHVTGLTIDGLENPDAPDEVDSYSRAQLVQARPPTSTDAYLDDLVVAPHRIGNTQKSLVSLERTQNAVVGPFRMTGLAGADYVVGDNEDHNGEVVYLGTAPGNLGSDWHPWEAYDETNNVRVHHIDASEGYGHAELVDLKPGTHHCTVEYCTSAGGGLAGDETTPTVISHNGHHNVVRWNEITDCAIGVEFDADYPEQSYANDLYGNRFADIVETALAFEDRDRVGLGVQGRVCGNIVTDAAETALTADCHDAVPRGDGVGHTGGTGPWG
jgi:hypothetical protein